MLGSVGFAPAAEPATPRVFLLDAKHLPATRQQLQTGAPQFAAALEALRRDADEALQRKPVSVLDKPVVPPSGDKHDYMSQAPYFWPNPATTNGLPYVRHDGKRNPEIGKLTDHANILSMPEAAQKLALAFYYTRDEKYAAHAALLIRTWFLSPETRMNPNFTFAQAVPGVNSGRGTGLIESRNLVKVVDAVGLLAGAKAWSEADQTGLEQWFAAFLDWMQQSRNGREERAAKNNHGTYYDVQVVSFALFLGRTAEARGVLTAVRTNRIPVQIQPDGRQPLELVRTKAWSYSVGNLSGLFSLATLGDATGVDLWHYQTPDGRGLAKALDYLIPFGLHEQDWPHEQLGGGVGDGLRPLLREAARHYPDRKYRENAGPAGATESLLHPPLPPGT